MIIYTWVLHMNMQRSDLNTIPDTLPQRAIPRNPCSNRIQVKRDLVPAEKNYISFQLASYTPKAKSSTINRRTLHSQMQTLAYATHFVFCHGLLMSEAITAYKAGTKKLGGST